MSTTDGPTDLGGERRARELDHLNGAWTGDELRAWAHDPAADAPKDWDVVLAAGYERAPVLVELVADPTCPNRQYLLGVLYIMAGQEARRLLRTPSGRVPARELQEVVELAERAAEPWLVTWATRTRALMEEPETFEYAAWCGHGLASRPLDG